MPPVSVETSVEQSLRDQVSVEKLREHLEVFNTLFRDTGSEDEWKSIHYVVDELRSYGLETEVFEYETLISWPLEGRLAILDDAGNEVELIETRTRAFGAQTPPGGVELELVFVPFAAPGAGEFIFAHRAISGDYSGRDIAGKAVLSEDGGPDGIRRAEERGAAAHIHIWPSGEDVIHEMVAQSFWGTPTPEAAAEIPKIPTLGIKKADGDRLAKRLASGPIRVRIEANCTTEWKRVPLATGYIPGTASDDFLLVGAHIDSWYEGITDNATGDAALLEMARILAAYRGSLRRGVKFGFWTGHSKDGFAGSTWYADSQFRTLRDHSIGYLNIDSPGVRGSVVWDCRYNMGEIEHLTSAVVEQLSGQTPNIRRPLRAGDQSFLGIGMSSLGAYRMLPRDHPDRASVGGCAGAWWWHSPADTLDKADAGVLAEDVKIYLSLTARMCEPEVIPYNFVASARDFLEHLRPLQEVAGQHLDLTGPIAAAERYLDAAIRLAERPIADTDRLNAGLRKLTRIVNPVLFTIDGPYGIDPMIQIPVLPGLAPMAELATLDPAEGEFHLLRTKLRRQKNRIEDALLDAAELAESLIKP